MPAMKRAALPMVGGGMKFNFRFVAFSMKSCLPLPRPRECDSLSGFTARRRLFQATITNNKSSRQTGCV
jgi:hypothetical protein